MNTNILLCIRHTCLSLHKAKWTVGLSPLYSSRILSTNVNTNPVTRSNNESKANIWKSSQISSKDGPNGAGLRRINLDFDLRKEVLEETTIYELGFKPIYRAIFALIVLQYIFFTVCASSLYEFYSSVKIDTKKLTSMQATITEWVQKLSSSRYLVHGSFFMVGNLFAFVLCFAMKRFVSFIRIMPGGEQVKIGTLTIFGGQNPNVYQILKLSDISCPVSRSQNVTFYNLNRRGHYFGFIIDANGRILNERLFDHTVCVKRNIT